VRFTASRHNTFEDIDGFMRTLAQEMRRQDVGPVSQDSAADDDDAVAAVS
jgi:hypothetical protein